MVIQFPVQEKFQLHMLKSLRSHCETYGLDRRKTEREFMRAGCTKHAQNLIWEETRRQRMNQGHGPQGAA